MDHKTIGGREIRIVFAEENRKTPQEMRRTTHVRYGKTFLTPVLHRYSVLIASVFFPVQKNTTFTSLAYWFFLNFVSSDRHGGSSRGRTSSRSPRHRHRCQFILSLVNLSEFSQKDLRIFVVLSKAYHENELFLKLMNLSLNNCDDLLIFFFGSIHALTFTGQA